LKRAGVAIVSSPSTGTRSVSVGSPMARTATVPPWLWATIRCLAEGHRACQILRCWRNLVAAASRALKELSPDQRNGTNFKPAPVSAATSFRKADPG